MIRSRFVIVRLAVFLGIGVLSACVEQAPASTSQPTPVVLPDGRIELQIVELERIELGISAHDPSLVRVCDEASYGNPDDDLACHIGILDSEHGLFIRLMTLQAQQECASFLWSPDRRRFTYHTHYCYPYHAFLQGDISVFDADGNLEQSFWVRGVHWSRDGRYLVVRTCQEPYMSISYTEVAYDTTTWKEVCTFGAGITPFPICSVGVEGECNLSFVDGSTQAISWNDTTHQVYSHCTNDDGDEIDCGTLYVHPNYSAYGTESETEHYQAFVEEHDLHIIDKLIDAEKIYTMPGYYITSIAWAPE
jgi:hypothetical protein